MPINRGGEIPPPLCANVSIVILAGGQGRRVGFCQKALLPYQGKPLLTHVLQRLVYLERPIWLNVNGESLAYQAYDLPQFFDEYSGFLGPLSGMHAAWSHVETEWVVFVPCDNPSLPNNLVERLVSGYQSQPAPLVVVHDGERIQPLYLLMHRSMQPVLEQALKQSHLSVFRWITDHAHTQVDFSKEKRCFQNINTLEACTLT